MKPPRHSWRPTTGQLTTTAIAIVFVLIGFWIGWQHRSGADPQTVTPSIPRGMRTKAVVIPPPTASGTTTGPATGTTTGTATGAASTPPTAVLPPRSQVTVAVLNAGGTAGAAVQIGVSVVQVGYPTPLTGNVTLPPGLVPTSTAPPAVPSDTGTSTRTGSSIATATSTGATTAATAPTAAAVPQVIYYRAGDQGIAQRLGTDLGITDIAPMPSTGVVQAAAPNAELIVVVGHA
jgi:hypothetical protein